MTKATEQDILDFVSELEAEPAPDSLGLASFAPGNDIPAKREKLAVLVSTGKAKRPLAFSSHTTKSSACRIGGGEVPQTTGSLFGS